MELALGCTRSTTSIICIARRGHFDATMPKKGVSSIVDNVNGEWLFVGKKWCNVKACRVRELQIGDRFPSVSPTLNFFQNLSRQNFLFSIGYFRLSFLMRHSFILSVCLSFANVFLCTTLCTTFVQTRNQVCEMSRCSSQQNKMDRM